MLVGCCAPALLFNTVTVFPANAPQFLLHIIIIVIIIIIIIIGNPPP